MGQRLVVSVIENNEKVASVYYHWSGYTSSSLMELAKLRDAVDGGDTGDTVLDIIRFLESYSDPDLAGPLAGQRGGVSPDDVADAESRWPGQSFLDEVNRNCGLVAISEEKMGEQESFAEGTATFDVTNRIASTDCVFDYMDYDEYAESYEEDGMETVPETQIPVIPYDLGYIPFDDLDGAGRAVGRLEVFRCDGDERIYEAIA